jgi:hypothetical protein
MGLSPTTFTSFFFLIDPSAHEAFTERVSKKPPKSVTPAQAGVQKAAGMLDSGFRRNDETWFTKTFWAPSETDAVFKTASV